MIKSALSRPPVALKRLLAIWFLDLFWWNDDLPSALLRTAAFSRLQVCLTYYNFLNLILELSIVHYIDQKGLLLPRIAACLHPLAGTLHLFDCGGQLYLLLFQLYLKRCQKRTRNPSELRRASLYHILLEFLDTLDNSRDSEGSQEPPELKTLPKGSQRVVEDTGLRIVKSEHVTGRDLVQNDRRGVIGRGALELMLERWRGDLER